MTNQKKNNIENKSKFFIAFALMFLFLTIPFVSAGLLSNIGKAISNVFTKVVNAVKSVVSAVANAVKNAVKTVTNVVTGKSGGGGGGGSSNDNDIGGDGAGEGDVYKPTGEGTLDAPVVVQGLTYTTTVIEGGALYHDVDLGNINFNCVNCPSGKGNVAGFDYLLTLEMFNKGNTMAEDVDLYVSITYPDNEKKDYSFKNTRLAVHPGSYTFKFTIPNVGIDTASKTLKPWALTKGIQQTAEIKLYAQVSNDKGVDRKEVRYKVTPQQECHWDWTNLFSPKYVCKAITPLTEVYEVDYVIEDTTGENEVKSTMTINTLSPDLYASGIFSRFG